VEHPLSPRSLDLADTYSHEDLPAFKDSLRGKGFIYLLYEGGLEPVEWYRRIMEEMAPHVIVVPVIRVPVKDDPAGVLRRMIPIATEYARRMDWGWGRPSQDDSSKHASGRPRCGDAEGGLR